MSFFGFGAGTIGALSALLTLLFAVGALVGGRLGDRFGRRKVFTVTMVGLAVGIGLLAGAQNVAMLYVATVIVGFSIGADLRVSLAMINEEAPHGAKGRLVAFSHVLWMLAIGTVLALQAVVGDLGVLGARIMTSGGDRPGPARPTDGGRADQYGGVRCGAISGWRHPRRSTGAGVRRCSRSRPRCPRTCWTSGLPGHRPR